MKRDWMWKGMFLLLILCGGVTRAAQSGDVQAEWVARIKAATDHRVMAFNYGPKLMKFEPQTGAAIAEAAWPLITKAEVKTGVLKAFAFGRSPQVLRVLHLGMTDPDPEVRRYAETYLRPLAMRTFDGDGAAYQAWREKTGGKPVEEVLRAGIKDLAERLNPMDPASGLALIEQIDRQFGAVDRRTSYPELRQAARDAGLFEVFSKWYHDPRTPPKMLPQVLELMGRLRSDREFLQKEVLPVLENASASDELRASAIRIVSESGMPEATDLLLRELKERYAGERVWELARALAEIGDPRTIPTMIGVIDADNSYDTIYGVGYFGLGYSKMRDVTQVEYSPYHDGTWWRRWWAQNKGRFPKDVQAIPIPDLPKTAKGKLHVPFAAELDTVDGKLKLLQETFEKGRLSDLHQVASEIGRQKDPKAIPLMIGIIDADNSYDTIYGVGYFGLKDITGVSYSEFHDGAWWRRWWAAKKAKYPKDVQAIPIPDFLKTSNGKKHVPFPENIETFEGRTAYLGQMIRSGKLGQGLGMSGIAGAYAEAGEPRAIPVLIGVIAADNTYASVYGVGYFGLGKLTGVPYDAKHDGSWWRQWWADNKAKYPEAAQQQEIPDFSKEVLEGSARAKADEAAAATADVADVPSVEIKIGGDARKRCFLIGPGKDARPPRDGYKLAIIMPGGDGSERFNPFVRRIYKNALGAGWIAVQPVAYKWHSLQQIVWPTKTNPALGQQFATEDFIEAIVAEVKARHPVNGKGVVTLSWSSSGPAAYAASLQKKKSITGSYVAMSVFRPEWFPPLANAKGHRYFIEHSPQDRLCPYAQAQAAREQLAKMGAQVEFAEYEGGHGWHGDIYGRIRKGMTWLTSK